MNTLIEIIIRHYKRIGVFLFFATLPFAYFYAQQNFYSHVSMFFDKNDPSMAYYKQFQKKFGNDEVAAIVFQSDNIFTAENIDLVRKITTVAQSIDDVENVLSLTQADVAVATGDTVGFQKLIPETGELSPNTLAAIREKSLGHPVIAGNLISKDGTITAIMVKLAPMHDNEQKHTVLNHLRDRVVALCGDKVKLLFSGEPYLELEVEGLTRKDNKIFVPLTIVLIIMLVYVMLRSFTMSVLCQINILVILMWAIGLMFMCGESLNAMTVLIAPIILAISIADSIHILTYYKECYRENGGHHTEAVHQSIRALWMPCLLTSLTTGAGFLSFVTSMIRPVKIVGIFTSMGVMIGFAMTIVLMPVMMMALRPWIERSVSRLKPKSVTAVNDRFMDFLSLIARSVTRHYKVIGILFLALTVAVSIGLIKLQYKTASITYLKDDNPVKQDILFVDKHFRGTVPVELVLRSNTPDWDFTHPESLEMVERIQRQIMEGNKDLYTSSFSVADYIKENHRAFNGDSRAFDVIPDNQDEILDYYELGDAAMLNRVITPDKMETRISFASRFVTDKNSKNFVEYIENEIRPILKGHFTLTYTGMSGLYITLDRNLKISQARSFVSAFILIFLMMLFVCKNFKLTVISMIPNLFPILMTLGTMGLLGIPLDGCTIMIASVTIGIAVDDTIHFVIWFRRNTLEGMDTADAIQKTFRDTGKPIVITSMVLCLGYLVITLGSVKPAIAFGALAGMAMFMALIGDLFILPTLLMVFKPSFQKDSAGKEAGALPQRPAPFLR